MIRIIDNNGRTIDLENEADYIAAKHNGNEIGRFEFDLYEDDYNCKQILTHANIDPSYQRSGIGVEMIKAAEDWLGDFLISNERSIEGASFINKCRKVPIFTLNHNDIEYNK